MKHASNGVTALVAQLSLPLNWQSQTELTSMGFIGVAVTLLCLSVARIISREWSAFTGIFVYFMLAC